MAFERHFLFLGKNKTIITASRDDFCKTFLT